MEGTTLREFLVYVLQEYLTKEEAYSFPEDVAYERACDLADIIFDTLGVSSEEQDMVGE